VHHAEGCGFGHGGLLCQTGSCLRMVLIISAEWLLVHSTDLMVLIAFVE
jgi:hypothetical protein